jgi:chemotaxis signal transduction protein
MTRPSHDATLAAQILQARTRALAERKRGVSEATPTSRVVVFQLGGALYGIAIRDVFRIVPAGATTPLPGAGWAVLGIVGVEGQVITVIDVNATLSNPDLEPAGDDHLIVLRRIRPRIAIRCSRVLSVADVSLVAQIDQSAPPPPGVAGYAQTPPELAGTSISTIALIDLNWVVGALPRQ